MSTEPPSFLRPAPLQLLASTWRRAWPWPAAVVWAAAGAAWRWGPGDEGLRAVLALALSLGGAMTMADPWRRLLVAAGFPLAAALSGATAGWSPWWWLAALLPLLLLYPLRTWRDAPLFPTPHDALMPLASRLPAPLAALDAGCGLGDGLIALRAAWPQARLTGLEWSWPLVWQARRRLPADVHIERADLWAAPWTSYQLVYVFQRPESMARVWDKASRELAPGAWLVSLAFEVPGQTPQHRLDVSGGHTLFAYRLGPQACAEPKSGSTGAGNCR